MIERKSTFFLGLFILILSSSFLGLPSSWKATLVFLSGVTLILLSVKLTLPKKPTKNLRKKEKVTPIFVENSPIYPPIQAEANSNPQDTEKLTGQTENTDQSKIR